MNKVSAYLLGMESALEGGFLFYFMILNSFYNILMNIKSLSYIFKHYKFYINNLNIIDD